MAEREDGRALGEAACSASMPLGALGLRHRLHHQEGAHVPEEVGDQVEEHHRDAVGARRRRSPISM